MFNVYKILNSINSKIYIGRTTHSLAERWNGHMTCYQRGDNRHLYSAMRKYGVENFHIELIEECDSFDDMVAKEAYYCNLYKAYTEGYNMTTAGEINPMECEKSRASHDSKMRSEEVRKKISSSMKKVRRESNKTVLIHKGKKAKRISKDELDRYINLGYELGSNMVGKIRIYRLIDLKENSVWPEELESYLNNGWAIGGKPNRISESHRAALNESRFKKVQGLCIDGTKTTIFDSVKEATNWWYQYCKNNSIRTISRADKDSYALADYIKKSSKEGIFIYNIKWYYIESNRNGGDVNEKVENENIL